MKLPPLAGPPHPTERECPLNQTKLLFPLIFISREDDSSIVIPPQPTDPGEIMSGGEGEPVEADVPAEDETIAPQGIHVTGTQTVTHEYLTLNGKVARETIKTNDSLTAVLDGPMVKRRPPVHILPCSGSGSWMHIGMRSQPRIKIRNSREPAKGETFIFSRFLPAFPARAGRSARRPTRSVTPTATAKKATAA